VDTKDYDVVLIGYGPVGVLLANMLGRDGHSVLALDRMQDIYDKPRAINIDHEVMRALQSVGLADEIESRTISHPGTDFVGMNERVIKVFEPPVKPYPLHWSPNLMFIQPEFEPVLRKGAERFPSVTAMLGTTFLELKQDGDGVDVAFEHNSTKSSARAKYVIGCDGGTSSVRRQLGVQQDSLDFDEWWTVIDAWQTKPTPLPPRTRQYCLPDGPATYVVGPKTLRRWEIKLLPGETPDDFNDADHVRKRLSAYVDPDAIDLWRVATYRFHALVAHQWQVGRVFLAGDAAHQMPPFMAQGLCSGVRDAVNLCWKLSGVLSEKFDEMILASYEEERKPHIRQLVATAKHLGEIIGELDLDKARERDETLGDELDSGRAVTLRQRLIPDLEKGILARTSDGRPASLAGTLFPQPEIRTVRQEKVLLDDIVGDNFLLVFKEEAGAYLADGGIEYVILNLLPSGATPSRDGEFVDLTGTLCGWFDRNEAAVAVVRPDKYVFGVAPSLSDLPALLRQLQERIPHLPSNQSNQSKRIAG